MKAEDRYFIIKQLYGKECQCGKPKKPKLSLCYSCYKRLPPDMQEGLYFKSGDGYEEAYDEAVGWLAVS